jgi:serine/threonine protein kinase
MQDNKPDLALSRTFKLTNGVLSAADQAEQWAQVLSRHGGAQQTALVGGEIVDSKYRILDLVGIGGMGSVYRVQHLLLGKEMALKTFSAATLTTDAWLRFQREAQAIGKLTHVNIVQVFDFGIGKDNVPYYTMELLSGQSLSDKLASLGRLNIEEALPVFISAADALSHAHKLHIVHRDIKPANIFLNHGATGKTVVKVVDFGIAKLATAQSIDDQSQTDIGLVFGSPLYMSPEQSMGEITDHRTDIYSYGCSLYEVLTGKPPFLGKNAFDTISMHQYKVPPPLVEASGGISFSPFVEALVARLLAKDVAGRYQSFDDVLADLAKIIVQDDTTSDTQMPAKVSPDRNSLLLENTQDTWQELSQGISQQSTGAIASRQRQLPILFGGVVVLVTLALGLTYLAFFAKHQPQTERLPAPAPMSATSASDQSSSPANYYSSPWREGSKLFQFPTNMGIGSILWNDGPERSARGSIVVPVRAYVEFSAGDPMRTDPSLFDHFRSDDLSFLNCSSDELLCWNAKHLEAITRNLTGLKKLDFTGASIATKDIELLNRLHHITDLVLSETNLTGPDLLLLKRLPQIKVLEINHLKKVPLLLEKLKSIGCIDNLSVDDCDLTDADMKSLASLKTVRYLSAEHNTIGPKGLKDLTKATGLLQLLLGGATFGPECLDTFRLFKKLQRLRFTAVGWSDADLAHLHKALPQCEIQTKEDGNPVAVFLEDKQ